MYKYIFNQKDKDRLISLYSVEQDKFCYSTRYYLSEYVYIEQISVENSYVYKIHNSKLKTTVLIESDIFDLLKTKSLLTIKQDIYISGFYRFYIIDKPLKLCVIETQEEQKQFSKCELSEWNLFKRFITVCGTFGVGKTEFAKGLSYILNTQFGGTSIYIPEYATDFIKENGLDISYSDQLIMYYNQRKREIEALNTLNICISDCPTFLSYIYLLFIPSKYKKNTLKQLYTNVLNDVKNYTDIAMILSHGEDVPNNNIRETYKPKQLQVEETMLRFLDNNSVDCSYVRRDMINRYIYDLFFINRIGN